jgi:hypothetical protein
MSKPLLVSSKHNNRLALTGLAISSAVLSVLLTILLSFALGVFIVGGAGELSNAGQYLFFCFLFFLLYSVFATIGYLSVILLTKFHAENAVKAAKVVFSVGLAIGFLPVLGSLVPLVSHFSKADAIEIFVASAFLDALFMASPFGQYLAMRKVSGAQKRLTIASTKEQRVKLAELLQASNLEDANLLAADYLELLGDAETNASEALSILPQKLLELNQADLAESVSSLHLRLVEQSN